MSTVVHFNSCFLQIRQKLPLYAAKCLRQISYNACSSKVKTLSSCCMIRALTKESNTWFLNRGKFQVLVKKLTPSQTGPVIVKPIVVKSFSKENDLLSVWAKIVQQVFYPQDPKKSDSILEGEKRLSVYSTYCLSYLNGQVVGAAVLRIQENVGGLWSGAVLPEARNKGVATAMAIHRIQIATDKGCKEVFTIFDPQQATGNYFIRLGFSKCCLFISEGSLAGLKIE